MKKLILTLIAVLVAGASFATVSVNTNRIEYSCNGSTTVFTYPFKIFEDDDLVVVKNNGGTDSTLTLNVDYTVTRGTSSGSITLDSGGVCGSGYTLTMIRNINATQENDYQDGGLFSAESFESALDRLTILQQQNKEQLDRSIHFQPGESPATQLPDKTTRANTRLGFDSSGEISTTTDSTTTYNGEIVENYTALESINVSGLADKTPAQVQFRSAAGDGGGGWFYWSNSDLSAEVASDTQKGVYVPPSSDTSGASGSWVRQYNGDIFTSWFGSNGEDIFDDTDAINAASLFASGGHIRLGNGNYIISDTIQLREFGQWFVGEGPESTTLTMTDDTKFAINLFSLSTTVGVIAVKDMKVVSKNGIVTRFLTSEDFENNSNPIKRHEISNVLFVGSYDPTSDVSAGSNTIPTWSELVSEGVGIHSVMSYRLNVSGCEFINFGIGFSSIGNNFSVIEKNRFLGNAVSIYDERTLWYGSAFGMGADNIYFDNDILDNTRVGGVTFVNTFGNIFKNNYMENLDRGQLSSDTLLYLKNSSHSRIYSNHFNASLSVTSGNPFIKIESDDTRIGEASNNRIFNNKLTPRTSLTDAVIAIDVTDYDRLYPNKFNIYDNSNFPIVNYPYVIRSGKADKSRLSFNNINDLNSIGDVVSLNDLLFIYDAAFNSWYLANTEPGAGTASLNFKLYLDNLELSGDFEIVITADDNATGNGRLFTSISDETGVIFNDYLFNGITGLTTTVVPITGGATAGKVFNIDFTNMAFSRVFDIYVRIP